MGLTIFIIGLFKKVMVADYFATISDIVFSSAVTGWVRPFDAWTGVLAYSLQIYFDFSGYCDMAIGLSLLFGILLPFNFDSPYKATSIVDFWRRWHITLSRFLRDYVYIPLGGNRFGRKRRYLNLLLTMLLGGLWHGAGWTYLIWGGLHGTYLALYHTWRSLLDRTPWLARASETTGYGIAALVVTQCFVVMAWVFFRASSVKAAVRLLAAMLGLGGLSGHYASESALTPGFAMAAIACAYFACMVFPNVRDLFTGNDVGLVTYRKVNSTRTELLVWRPSARWAAAAAAGLIAGLLAIQIAGDSTPFLYFQF